MAATGRRTDTPLASLLLEEGCRFDFFQAVRLLERLYPHREPVGRDAVPAAEVVRFRSHVSLSFPPSAIQEITPRDEDNPPVEMSVSFIGLTGPLGVLPRHYTEFLIERARHKDGTLRDFFDLFNHRLISLFYRAWEKYHFPVAYERTALKGREYDPFSRALLNLIGMGTEGLLGRLAVEDGALMFWAGLLARHARCASALEGVLRDYFEVMVRVRQFTGQWLQIPEESRTCLGKANGALGVTAVVGSRFWDPQAKFTVEMGPLALTEFRQFLPSGDAFRPLSQLTCFFAGEELDFDVQLTLKAAEVPWCRLRGADQEAPQLGWTTWLKTKEFTRDASDAVFPGRPAWGATAHRPADASTQAEEHDGARGISDSGPST